MARVGLEFGEKINIGDKSYRTLNDGLVDLKEIFGQWTFRRIEGQDLVYEDDITQPRRQDGSYPQIATGEVRGVVIALNSSLQQETVFVTICDQTLQEIEELGLKFREEVDLQDVLVTYNMVRDNQFKLFASSIVKKSAGNQKQNPPKQEQHKENHG